MTTYHIFLKNQASQGGDEYTLYRNTPLVNGGGWIPTRVFSNSFQTRNVPVGGVWPIDINDTPYAYVGTSSSQDLHPGDQIRDTAHKLVKILPQGNGSTVTVYNNGGRPGLNPNVKYTAPPGFYGIETGNDFVSSLRFVAGFSGMDDDGQPRPFATFKLEPSSSYSVIPNAKFYLGNFASQPGSLIDYHDAVAEIDFDAYPGLTNAIVTHRPDGSYEVNVVPAAVFAMETANAEPVVSAASVQLTQLKQQAKLMSNLIDAALGISITEIGDSKYECTAEWKNNPSFAQKSEIAIRLVEEMRAFGYIFQPPPMVNPRLSLLFSHAENPPVGVVLTQWRIAIFALPAQLKQFITNPRVQRIWLGPAPASQPEASDFPGDLIVLPKPQWRCSVNWMESPSPEFRGTIAKALVFNMGRRGYFGYPGTNTEEKFEVDFYHFEPTDLGTATKDWLDSYNELGYVHQWVVNPRTETLFHTQTEAAATTSTASDGIVLPMVSNFLATVQWIEGPNEDTRDDITEKLVNFLRGRGYDIEGVKDLSGLEWLMVTCSTNNYTPLTKAQADWLAACNSLGFQRMFVTNPLVANNDVVTIDDPSSSAKKYIGGLTWLEGPGEDARDDIIRQLKASLRRNDNKIGSIIRFPENLMIVFSHAQPTSLPDAQRDWQTAFDSIRGNQRNYITKPFCEEDKPVHKTASDGANGSNGAQASIESNFAPVQQSMEMLVPAVRPFAERNETLEEKKRRALELLQREGLVGIAA